MQKKPFFAHNGSALVNFPEQPRKHDKSAARLCRQIFVGLEDGKIEALHITSN